MLERRMRVATVFILLLITTVVLSADGMKYGQKPNLTQAKLDSDVLAVYNKWKGDDVIEDMLDPKPKGDGYLATYKEAGTSKPIYIIKGDATGDAPKEWKSYGDSELTIGSTSEATGYGMLVFALMADKDPNAQKYFDGLLNLYLRNLSTTEVTENGVKRTLNTMSWMIPTKYTTTGGVQPARSGSACDGDMDIAYALLLADKVWGDVSTYANTNKSYKELAVLLIKDIKDYIISSDTNRVLMGDSYFFETTGIYDSTDQEGKFNHSSTRPSDWMVGHLRAFSTVVPDSDGKWGKAIDEIYRILPIVSGDSTGLAPDFVEDINGIPSPGNKSVTKTAYNDNGEIVKDDQGNAITFKAYMENWKDDMYGHNACRVPWRIALDYVHYGTEDAKKMLTKLNSWSAGLPTRKLRGGTDNGWDNSHNDDWWTSSKWYDVASFPKNIATGYTLDGKPVQQEYDNYGKKEYDANWDRRTPWIDIHFVTPIAFANTVADGDRNKLNAAWSTAAEYWGGDHSSTDGYTCYFGDSINLLNMLLISGNWESPTVNNNVTSNYKIVRTGRWYDRLQDAVDASRDNDTILAYDKEPDTGSFCTIDAKNNLTIETAPGRTKVIAQSNSPYAIGLRIRNSSNVTIKNFEIRGFFGNVSIGKNCNNTVLDGVILRYGKGAMKLAASGKNTIIKNSFIDGGMYIEDSENVTLHHNVINIKPGGMAGPALGISNNNNKGKIKIYNNVITGSTIGIHAKSGNIDIKNNIFEGHKYTKHHIYTEGSPTISLDYNLYYNKVSSTVYTNGIAIGSHSVKGDPMLDKGIDGVSDHLNYTLKTGSAARNSGTSISGITDDVTDGSPDIGWKEAVDAAAPPTYWSSAQTYKDGSRITRYGQRYIANWDNKNTIPGSAPYPYSPWTKLSYPSTVSSDNFNWGTGSWYKYNGPSAYSTFYNENGVLRTDIYYGGTNVWDVQVAKKVSLEKGKYYTVVFDAKTESAVDIQVVVSMSNAPYTPYSLYEEIKLTSEMTQYSFTFRMDHPTDYNAVLEFDLGGEVSPQDIWIDNVKLIKE